MGNFILAVIWALACLHAVSVVVTVRKGWVDVVSAEKTGKEAAGWASFIATNIFFLCCDIMFILFVFGAKLFLL